jgi:hypothetical protein
MKYLIIYVLANCLLFIQPLRGQEKFDVTGELLETLFRRISDTIPDSQKLSANDSIKQLVEKYAGDESVFYHRFDNVRYLGQITSPDSAIKIITWNLVLRNGKGKYFCYFVKHGENGKTLIYPLSADYNDKPVATDTTYFEKNWYGALYYDLKPYTVNNRKCWVLLGLDYGNPQMSRKIIEVLEFTDDGLKFGRRWFDVSGVPAYRVVFGYASTATMSLRFSSDTSIVFDHLVPFSTAVKGDRQYYAPDYSYDSYTLIKGVWRFSLNVDARNRQ